MALPAFAMIHRDVTNPPTKNQTHENPTQGLNSNTEAVSIRIATLEPRGKSK
jgi:hypothetical protein